LVPDTDGISPATVAWFLHRLVAEQRESLPETSERVLADIDLPSAPVLALMQRTGITVDRAALDSLNAELGETTTEDLGAFKDFVEGLDLDSLLGN
jgi:DNA polymerase-1